MASVTVMGAGVLGLSAAFVLARRGARVRVVERTRVGAGASGGVVGALAPHAPERWDALKQFQFDSLMMAPDFWAEVAEIGGTDPGYARLGRVQPLADDAAVARAQARAETARALWQGLADWRVVPVGEAPGMAVQSASGLVVFDTLGARLSPRAALAALEAALAALGTRVEPGEAPPPGADAVVWATGAAGLADLSAALEAPAGVPVKGQAALLAADWRDAPQLYAPGLHVVPHADGLVAVGSTSEREFAKADATDDQLDAVIARARALCPALARARVVERWAGLRPRARSRRPMLGAWPERPGHFVLNGGFKTGFGMAPKLADVIVRLLLDADDRRPEGFGVEASLPASRR